jgi:hypothetical protein
MQIVLTVRQFVMVPVHGGATAGPFPISTAPIGR